jgi:uncharacterized protein (DUF302 family)
MTIKPTTNRIQRGRCWLIAALLTLCAANLTAAAHAQNSGPQAPDKSGAAWVYSTQGEYNNVKLDLVDAIESYGMVVSYTAHAASMLERTSGAVGAMKQVYDFADILLFCKANTTYDLTLANPHNIVLCPYSISVYSLREEPGKVYLSFRKPDLYIPEWAVIHQMLEDIVSEVID